MNQRINSRTSLFLMELIVAVFFFSLSAAVCVKLFVASHELADKTVNLNHAVTWSQSIAESFVSAKGDINEIGNLYPSAFISDNNLIIFFDDNWEYMDGNSAKASFEAILSTKEMPASKAYSDVTKYNIQLNGNAICGTIKIVDVRGLDEPILEIDENNPNIIHSISVDTYRGN
ncbi:hypothetical protein SAMN04487928_104116 [Butyrivibrio proteoclasticus]|uniref:Prepilin-type N-terminal cleavage/methylation domain-containing protein n=1 Tax=Butyrivibrio proteoclasticus TaxID=43305 RepID=A0A1I5RNM4_9FIRM|nr:hypothetical protein [Butyrivibrio proteoclasticus]SFP60135.1 hypothetical protein SAMN04487928_104116 [Butyrivibrio proteoclasticus]